MAVRWRALLSEVKDGWPAGLFIGGLLVASMIAWVIWWRDRAVTASDSIRYAGTLLELFGLVTVAIGLSEVRRLFGRPSLLAKIAGWFARVRSAFRRPEPITLSGVSAIGSVGVLGEGRVLHRAPEDAPIERRVSVLEKNLDSAFEELDRKTQRFEKEIATAKESVMRESRERAAENEGLSRKIEEMAVGGIHVEIVGLGWIVVGMIATNIPGEIAGLFLT